MAHTPLLDPRRAACPDYSSEAYAACRNTLIQGGMEEAAAVEFLVKMWETQNVADIAIWDAREAERQAATAENDRIRREAEAAAEAMRVQEIEAADKEERKKNRAKFLPIGDGRVPDTMPIIVPAAITAKLRAGHRVDLWHYTNAGLLHASADLDAESNRAGSFVAAPDGTVEFRPTLAAASSRAVIQDRDLSMEDFMVATYRLLAAMKEAGWPKDRVRMFADFWNNINNHPRRVSRDPRDVRALLLYQDEQRTQWHNITASATGATYDLSVINEVRLDEAFRTICTAGYDREIR
ncbi:hypothetical protein JR316_0010998 [Psilocybe cubensis]|uniref:Uncharacterized protein n=2 Tax=Psilocybe cubensis TaxID=181762 RepID=A0A8H7XLK4_PSICU|nr:hypothetical protein JR316_0010998 [Psilocybe cubensis]KAH9477082.1 hypothetical protein JR316_0010998 [Psilocybe cubensis]